MDDHATFLRNWAADIRKNSGQSVDADRLDEIAKVLSAAPSVRGDGRMTMEITDAMVEALKVAIEGECDGLAIDDQQAKAILQYVLPAAPVALKVLEATEQNEYARGVRDGLDEALQIARDQAKLMADLVLEGLPDNAREREAMEAALSRFAEKLSATLDYLAAPVSAEPQPVDATAYNAAFDPANDAFGGAFKDGFREGWLFASDPSFDNREQLEADYHYIVDIAPSECWDAYREKYFAMLPLAAIPTMGEVATSPPDLAAEIARLREVLEQAWRPINTAPMDGTTFIAVMAEAYSPRATLCRAENGKFYSPSQGEKFVLPGWNQWWPTHWMPLPTPPARAALADQKGGAA